ncbi:TPA: H-NS family nucleoid-associated regulatory protein [Stenotrophomonas maltophilia]|nr:H-NS histone family protein [Stenotrophomonas maltophilia]
MANHDGGFTNELGRTKRSAGTGTREEVAPKYWLPQSQETWTGHRRTPRSFLTWLRTQQRRSGYGY